MEYDGIATLAFIWVVYMFLFTEADRQIAELLNRLKSSLAISDKGVFEVSQFIAKQSLGITELVDYGEILNESSSQARNIRQFYDRHRDIERGKKFLIANLFLLSLQITMTGLFQIFDEQWLIISKVHIIFSLLFALVFYVYASKTPQVKYIKFVVPDKNVNQGQ